MNSDEEMMGEENQSDAGLSPAPSVYSLTESLKEQSIRFEHGREVNNHSEIYKLAADEREARRLGMFNVFYLRVDVLYRKLNRAHHFIAETTTNNNKIDSFVVKTENIECTSD